MCVIDFVYSFISQILYTHSSLPLSGLPNGSDFLQPEKFSSNQFPAFFKAVEFHQKEPTPRKRH